jgi:hypothetical protein
MSGLGSLMDHHAHRTITIDDLARSWSRTSGRDLCRWATETLIPQPVPTATNKLDEPPPGNPPDT